jgi:protease I
LHDGQRRNWSVLANAVATGKAQAFFDAPRQYRCRPPPTVLKLTNFSPFRHSVAIFPLMETMMAHIPETRLAGLSVAILVTDGFEQVEMTGPREALEKEGAATHILSAKPGKVRGFRHDEKADEFEVAKTFDQAAPADFDGVLLPGGVMNGDAMRMIPEARRFVEAMQADGKPIAVICHGGWLLVSAGLVKGRTMTSWPSLQDDIRNAGGNWVDQEVAVDGNLVSSRKPQDIPAFNRAFIAALGQRVAESVRGTSDEKGSSVGVDA